MEKGFGELIEWGAAPRRLPNVRLVESELCYCAGCKGKNLPVCRRCKAPEVYRAGELCAECREREEV